MGFGPLQHRRARPIILALAQRLGMDEDLRFRLDEGVTGILLNASVGRLHGRRVIGGAVPLQRFDPLPPLRFMVRDEWLKAGRLLCSTLHLRVPFARRRGLLGRS